MADQRDEARTAVTGMATSPRARGVSGQGHVPAEKDMAGTGAVPGAGRPRVGRQVHHWRSQRALTLAQVAERSGLNVGYLSQIENDKACPSLDALATIGRALEVPTAWFLLDSTPPPVVVRAAQRRSWTAPGGGGSIEEVDGGLARDLRIVYGRIAPGRATGFHTHTGMEHHVILSGRMRATQGDHTVELGPGDYLLWDATVPHDAAVVGDEPVELLIISDRAGGTESAPPRD